MTPFKFQKFGAAAITLCLSLPITSQSLAMIAVKSKLIIIIFFFLNKLHKDEKHQTRVSLSLELISDAYLTANRTWDL